METYFLKNINFNFFIKIMDKIYAGVENSKKRCEKSFQPLNFCKNKFVSTKLNLTYFYKI